MTRVYLTGASGFVGRGVLSRLCHGLFTCTIAVRSPLQNLPVAVRVEAIESLASEFDLRAGLKNQDVVVHCAGRAHVVGEQFADSLSKFRNVNVSGTLALAKQAAEVGVRRFVFISSIGVNGNQSYQPFTVEDAPRPVEPYAISKCEAEVELRKLSVETGMEVVIIRPPLVYGPNAPGNFGRLIRILSKRVPLPLGAIHNQRSLVALDNLADLIVTCIDHASAANHTFLVSDGEDISTTELLLRMGKALGKPVRLLPVPSRLLEVSAALLGKQALSQRLIGSLQVDISKTRELLGWTPPVSVDEALRKTARNFLEQQKK